MIRFYIKTFLLFSFCLFSFPSHAFSAFDSQYSQWADFLNRYVREGRVDYASVKKSPELLLSAAKNIEEVHSEEYDQFSRNEKMAFWINAYHISIVRLVIEHYPIKKVLGWRALIYPENSVQQIPDVWNRPVLMAFGRAWSLDDIEHEKLRREFQDPRIHFAVNCASLGCTRLRGEPYLGDRLDKQLDEQIWQFLSDPEKVHYDSVTDTLYLSPLFKWFGKDFESSGGFISFIKSHWTEPEAKQLSNETKIKWLGYDWSLNEQ